MKNSLVLAAGSSAELLLAQHEASSPVPSRAALCSSACGGPGSVPPTRQPKHVSMRKDGTYTWEKVCSCYPQAVKKWSSKAITKESKIFPFKK